jgi:hypothetical protein
MPRSYAVIATEIWSDESFRALPAMAQRTYFILCSQGDISACGVLILARGRWASYGADTTPDDIMADIRLLDERRYVVLDESFDELLVRSFMRWDKGYGNAKRLPVILADRRHVLSKGIRAAIDVELTRLGVDPETGAVGPKDQGNTLFHVAPDGSLDMPSDGVSSSRARTLTLTLTQTQTPNPLTSFGGPGGLTESDPAASVQPAPGQRRPNGNGAPVRRGSGKGTRIPDGFQPDEAMLAWARSNAPSCGRADHESFVDYWTALPGAKAEKLDWPATWRNWMRRTDQDRGGVRRVNGHSGLSTADTRVTQAALLGARLQAEADSRPKAVGA